MKYRNPIFLVVFVLLLAGLGFYYWSAGSKAPAIAPPEVAVKTVKEAPEHPVPEVKDVLERAASDPEPAENPTSVEADSTPLPTNLDASDPNVMESLSHLIAKERLEALVLSEGFIRRFVVTLENASGPAIPSQNSVFKPAPGNFEIERNEVGPVLSSKNYARYDDFVSAFVSLNSKSLVTFYTRYYSFFQSAYAELGMTGYFNDRLIAAIDKALSAPSPKAPIQMIEKGYYKFVDPELEKLSAVQKLMIRIGPEKAALVKQKLKRIRRLLVN